MKKQKNVEIEFTPVIRQGDTHFFEINEFPNGERSVDKQCEKKHLAYGEQTGHVNEITSGNIQLFRILDSAYNNLLFIHVKDKAVIEHGREKEFTGVESDQEYHAPVELPAGKYCMGIVQEVDHLSGVTRRVAD